MHKLQPPDRRRARLEGPGASARRPLMNSQLQLGEKQADKRGTVSMVSSSFRTTAHRTIRPEAKLVQTKPQFRVGLADNDETVHLMVRESLQTLGVGWILEPYSSLEQAMEQISLAPPEVLVMD